MLVSMETVWSDRRDVMLWLADCLKLSELTNELGCLFSPVEDAVGVAYESRQSGGVR